MNRKLAYRVGQDKVKTVGISVDSAPRNRVFAVSNPSLAAARRHDLVCSGSDGEEDGAEKDLEHDSDRTKESKERV